jgi:hypothetical protein
MPTIEELAIKPIETAIANHTSDHFVINQNYEIVIPESGKSLLHPNYFDGDTLGRLFEKLYQNKTQFVPNDVEVDSSILVHRLNALSMFLKRRGEDVRPIGRIITNVRSIEGCLKIESMTLRVFDDFRNPLFSKPLMRPEVKAILNGFCQQREVEKQYLLKILKQLKE